MTIDQTLHTEETRQVETHLRRHFPHTVAYRYNPASIRVRVVDPRFAGLSKGKRFDMVIPHIRELPDETQMDITLLVLLTPDEVRTSTMNMEFENPTPSRL